jgi:hypothetical protein
MSINSDIVVMIATVVEVVLMLVLYCVSTRTKDIFGEDQYMITRSGNSIKKLKLSKVVFKISYAMIELAVSYLSLPDSKGDHTNIAVWACINLVVLAITIIGI